MKLFTKSLFLISLFVLNLFLCPVVWSDEDVGGEDVEEDAVINEEPATANEETIQETQEEPSEPASDEWINSSPYVTTHVLFIQPESTDLPAGKIVRLLASFRNNGSSTSYLVDSIEASLRYPQDFQYHIQNFTTFPYNKLVDSEHEATFEYSFIPSEVFNGRPFGLVININYRSLDGKEYTNSLFNSTINIVDADDGLDGETFFLYIFLAAIAVLLVVVGHHYFSSTIRKRVTAKSQSAKVLSNGGNNSEDIDFAWIPKEHLQTNTPRTSPRQRRNVKEGGNAGSASETESK